MTKCTLAGRQYLDDWKLLTAFPIKVVTAPSQNITGVAEVACLHWRPVLYWFRCCKGGYFPITGKQFGRTEPGPGSARPVLLAAIPVPFPGFLGEVASRLGVSLTIGVWFPPGLERDLASTCAGKPSKVSAESVSIPECEGEYVIVSGATGFKIPARVLPTELPSSSEIEAVETGGPLISLRALSPTNLRTELRTRPIEPLPDGQLASRLTVDRTLLGARDDGSGTSES